MRFVIVSDIHANFSALEVVHNLVKRWRAKEGVEYQYWFLGDLLGRGPDPLECLNWMRYQAHLDTRWVPGNHDEAILKLSKGAREDRAQAHEIKAWQIHLQILKQLENQDYWEWYQSEFGAAVEDPSRSISTQHFGNLTAVFVHGSVHRLDEKAVGRRTEYLYPWHGEAGRRLLVSDLKTIWSAFSGADKSVLLIHGHTHYPVFGVLDGDDARFEAISYGKPMQLRAGCLAINPGSVGQPKDGDPRAAFAVLDTEARTITFHRVMYDVQRTTRKMEEVGYPELLVHLVHSANGGAQLAMYRTVYHAPDLGQLRVNGSETHSEEK